MVNPKAMGIGSMFIFLILSVVLLPMIVRYIGMNEQPFILFQDLQTWPRPIHNCTRCPRLQPLLNYQNGAPMQIQITCAAP